MGQNMSKLGFTQENIGINPYQTHQYTRVCEKSEDKGIDGIDPQSCGVY